MIKDIVKAVEIFTKISEPPEMKESLMYRVVYRDGSKDEFTHEQWHEIVTRVVRLCTMVKAHKPPRLFLILFCQLCL